MSLHRTIESASIQTFTTDWRVLSDPTATTPEFAAVQAGSATSPTTFADGSWDGSYDTDTLRVSAVTPSFGASGADIELTEGETYAVYMRVGTEVVFAFTLRVN